MVPKHSACLNYTNEVSDGLDADHRGICKYERPTDPNYQKVRNALSASVERLVHDHAARNHENDVQRLQHLRNFLDIDEPPEDDLADRLESCLSDDTCSWFITRPNYQRWRNIGEDYEATNADLRDMILIEAEPGAGKSVLAAQVINDLRALNCGCSYFFFDAQDRQKSSLNCLLRSLAFQMALLSPGVRQSLLDLQQQGIVVRDHDDKYVWRKLFTNCILQVSSERPHYWVIDGLDECQQSTHLLQILLKTASDSRPRIFMTSRPDAGIRYELSLYQGRVSRLSLSHLDTHDSITTYVDARISRLRLRTMEERAKVAEVILHNAEGSYLWVKLVLDNINKATGPKQIMESIEQIPKGMDRLYADILMALERETSEEQKPIVKAVLGWTVCANPPLGREELEAAIKLDTESAIFVDKMCESLRGLVVIDHSGKVRPVHLTARAYLLKADLGSPFAVSPQDAHSRIASLLVDHIHQRLRRLRNASASQLKLWQQKKVALDDYALHHFSDHIRRAHSSNHDLFMETEKFFTDCGISWIACIALAGSLSTLVKTSQNLRTWLQTRLKETPPVGELARKTERMQQWCTDLGRIVAKFGRHLLECPGAIYALIPPFVPKESVLSTFRPRSKDLQVFGLENERWDDRLCSIFYEGSTCTAVACGKHNFAVALKNGTVFIYDNNTMQLLRELHHGAVVKLLKYNSDGSILLTSGFRKMKMWAIPEAGLMWECAIRELRLAAEFIEDGHTLISISSQHRLIKQDVATGSVLEANERRPSAGGHEPSRLFRRELQYAEFSGEAEMLATMQRERPIQLTDIEDRYEIGVIELELTDDGESENTEQPITAMTFCANIDVALLAAVYRDGVLAVFDRDLRLIEKRGDSKGATLLAGSPTGLHLAAASVEGVITLYDFEQLIPLHTLYTSSIENIRSLVFSGDGNRVIDVRDRQANIWAPPALFNQAREDTDSISESTLAPTVVTSHFTGSKEGISDVTSMIACAGSDYFLCGREDGTVAVYSTKDAKRQKIIFQDTGKQWVSMLWWKPKTRMLGALHSTSTVVVHALSFDWSISNTLMKHAFLYPVKQLFIENQNDKLKVFIVTSKTIHLWILDNISSEKCMFTEKKVQNFESSGLWVEDVSGFLIHAEPYKFAKFDWDMELLNSSDRITFEQPDHRSSKRDDASVSQREILSFDRGAGFFQGTRPMLFLRSISSHNTTAASPSASTPNKSSKRPRWIVDLSSTKGTTTSKCSDGSDVTPAALYASFLPVSHMVEHFIGICDNGRKLIFLDKRLWVCTYGFAPADTTSIRRSSLATLKDTTKQPPQTYTRHFFIPDDWISSNYSNANGQLLFTHGGTKEDCLIFVKKHEVVVIKNPFVNGEPISIM